MRENEAGEVRVFAEYGRDFVEETDVVVVGSGPSGSVVSYELARAGYRVVLLEEGPPFTPKDFRWQSLHGTDHARGWPAEPDGDVHADPPGDLPGRGIADQFRDVRSTAALRFR